MEIEDLSFVANRDGKTLPKPVGRQFPRCFWNVAPTGDYTADCVTGQRLALEYLKFEEQYDGPGLLGWICQDMPRPFTGVEVGFLQLVCFQARAGKGRAGQIAAHWGMAEQVGAA